MLTVVLLQEMYSTFEDVGMLEVGIVVLATALLFLNWAPPFRSGCQRVCRFSCECTGRIQQCSQPILAAPPTPAEWYDDRSIPLFFFAPVFSPSESNYFDKGPTAAHFTFEIFLKCFLVLLRLEAA